MWNLIVRIRTFELEPRLFCLMAKINLAALSLRELLELQGELPAVIAEKQRIERAELKAKMAALADEAGFSLNEVLGGSGKRGSKSPAAVKYRNPENPEETWSGRGRMANWLREKLAKRGAKIDDFAV